MNTAHGALVALMSLAAVGCSKPAATPASSATETVPSGFAGCPLEVVASAQSAVLTGGACVQSANGQYKLSFTMDGNLALQHFVPGASPTLIWHSALSEGTAGARTVALQGDGNMLIIENGKPVWQAANNGKLGNYKLVVTDDGHVTISPSGGSPTWTRPN